MSSANESSEPAVQGLIGYGWTHKAAFHHVNIEASREEALDWGL